MPYSQRIVEAFALAHDLHRDQRRKGSDTPYLTHLMSVAALVGEFGGSEDQFIAALLHDAVEDQGGLPVLKRIREQFGPCVADYVRICTDAHETPKPPWQTRKENHIAEVALASAETKLIVAADKLHNVRSIRADLRQHGEDVWKRFKGGRRGSLWYYQEMTAALSQDWDHPILQELRKALEALEL